jgi:Ca2+-binding RTX toxin-like protein
MRLHVRTGWLAVLAAVTLAAVAAVSADYAFAAGPKDKVKAQIKHGALIVEGTAGEDDIALRLRDGDSGLIEVVTQDGLAGHNLRRDRFDEILVEAGRGNDLVRIDESNEAFTATEATTLDGGDGDDVLRGGSAVETFRGGAGADDVDGNQGADVASLGAGDDSFTWDPGDGSDVVEGEDGVDTMVFNGSGQAEIFAASANGSRLRFTRNLGNIVMDVAGTENVDLRALGAADATTVNDLSATEVVRVAVDLALAIGGNAGDGSADTVTVNGTAGDNVVGILGANGSASVIGLTPFVSIAHSEAASDRLIVDGLAGDDLLSAGSLGASAILLTLNGGADEDSLLGGAGADAINGGAGTDFLNGGPGADQISCGGAGDTIVPDAVDTIAADCI